MELLVCKFVKETFTKVLTYRSTMILLKRLDYCNIGVEKVK